LQDTSALFIDQVTGTHRLAAISRPGQLFPLHSTANGKALLASLDAQRRRALLPSKLEAFTENTVTSLPELQQEIERIHHSRLAFDREEQTRGVCAIGTWFTDPAGRSYALSIPIPAIRFS